MRRLSCKPLARLSALRGCRSGRFKALRGQADCWSGLGRFPAATSHSFSPQVDTHWSQLSRTAKKHRPRTTPALLARFPPLFVTLTRVSGDASSKVTCATISPRDRRDGGDCTDGTDRYEYRLPGRRKLHLFVRTGPNRCEFELILASYFPLTDKFPAALEDRRCRPLFREFGRDGECKST